jgi:hypothetical protein
MKKRVLIGIGAVLLTALTLVVVSLLTTPVPTAFIRVLDEKGQAVAGATIAPDGLRPKKGGGHYGWTSSYPRSGVKPEVVTTDANGYAQVKYPFYVIEKLETEQISFAVDHPEFCAERPFRVVASSPPANASMKEKLKYVVLRVTRKISARPEPVVLKRGGIVRLRGYVGARENGVTNLAAEISNMWPAGTNFWQRTGPVLWSGKAAPGEAHLRAMHFPENGAVLFSQMVSFEVKAGETNEFTLELKPGVRVAGRLDESVPRPVRGARVCTRVFEEGHTGDSDAPIWAGWRAVGVDGTFEFKSLPPGRMEVIGLCDGFVSADGTPVGGKTSLRVPQGFPISGREQQITLRMEAAASCEVTVLDDEGKPLAGARAGFWPNVLWGGNGSTIFANDLFNSEDFFRNGTPANWDAVGKMTEDSFRAISDAQGVALVRNLPAGTGQDYSVRHTNFAMPILRSGGNGGRSASVDLWPGETGRVVVRMKKLGTEVLTH